VVRESRRVKIDRFGLGDWWPRPDQAVVGGLDHLPADQWPMLAAKWLTAGFDSPLLRQLAELRPGRHGTGPSAGAGLRVRAAPRGLFPSGNAHVPAQFRVALQALDLMPEVLRSIGFDPAPANEEFVARCQSALDVVQHDLDVTGYGRYRVRAQLTQWPTSVYAALPDGSYWSGAFGMTREMDDAIRLYTAAASVSLTIKEVDEIAWPVCAAHGGEYMGWASDSGESAELTAFFVYDEPVTLIDGVPWWWCHYAGHALVPVGQLTAEVAKTP
jgi:hypothetical protein